MKSFNEIEISDKLWDFKLTFPSKEYNFGGLENFSLNDEMFNIYEATVTNIIRENHFCFSFEINKYGFKTIRNIDFKYYELYGMFDNDYFSFLDLKIPSNRRENSLYYQKAYSNKHPGHLYYMTTTDEELAVQIMSSYRSYIEVQFKEYKKQLTELIKEIHQTKSKSKLIIR